MLENLRPSEEKETMIYDCVDHQVVLQFNEQCYLFLYVSFLNMHLAKSTDLKALTSWATGY